MQNQSSSFAFDADTENVNVINMNLTKLPFIPPLENKVKYLFISGNKFSILPENMREIIFVDLSNNSMGPLPPADIAKALSSYPKLKTLYLSDNKLEDIQDFFKNNTIDSFNLAQNRFRELPKNFFANFPKLETLSFDCNFLINFPKQKSESIVTLSMPLNCIENIEPSEIFFSQLTTLDLSKNQIKKLPNNFSKSFPKLSYLNLSDNLISEIPDTQEDGSSIFPESLRILDLSNNLLKKFSNSITSIQNLLILNIIGNEITYIPQLQPKIKKLRASKNKIGRIEAQSFNIMRHFTLAHNGITYFPTDIKMKYTETFKISHNKITEINFNSVPISTVLPRTITRFDISFNSIEKVPKEIFENLPNLEDFSANFNKLTELPEEIIKCRRLCILNVSNNPLKKLPLLPKSLEKVYASNCELETVDGVFQEIEKSIDDFNSSQNFCITGHVQIADFSRNKLDTFPQIPSIQILNLSQNRLKSLPCLEGKFKVMDLSMNELESCDELISCSSLVDINLSHNKLTEIPKLGDLEKLRYLELSYNKIEGELSLKKLPSLLRLGISQTSISLTEMNNKILEVITSEKDLNISTFSKSEDKTNSPFLKRPIYIHQDTLQKSGFSEFIGQRSEMEDSIILRDDLNLYAICDGHSGPDTAKFVAVRLCDLFENASFSHHMSSKLIVDIFEQTEKELHELELHDGSTLCLAYLSPKSDTDNNRKIFTLHLGDTRALIVRSDGKSRELTRDHKTTIRSEFERIRNEFGKLSNDNRIDGILGVSRSIGDFDINGVGREPEVNEFTIDGQNDRFLVIGCDGVFDALSNDVVAKIAAEAKTSIEASYIIRNAAFSSNSTDNISVIVVDLTK